MFYLADSGRESGPGLTECSCQAGLVIGQLVPIPGLSLVSHESTLSAQLGRRRQGLAAVDLLTNASYCISDLSYSRELLT